MPEMNKEQAAAVLWQLLDVVLRQGHGCFGTEETTTYMAALSVLSGVDAKSVKPIMSTKQ